MERSTITVDRRGRALMKKRLDGSGRIPADFHYR